jgi:hypothetical protein
MLPSKNDIKWKQLVTGKIQHDFKSIPAGMMVSRHKRETSRNGSDENVIRLAEEAYNFFAKFEKILQEDIKAIFG